MIQLAALVISIAGFAALALSMHKHHRDVFGTAPTRGRTLTLQGIGWLLLSASVSICIAHSGWSIGLVLWIGLLTFAALTVALLLTYALPSVRRSSAR